MSDYKKTYREWMENTEIFSGQIRQELAGITDEREIEDRFYRDLEFGTGGLRGILGAGTNRMNIYTVGKATEGLARHLKQNCGPARAGENSCVVISFDSRRMSPEFARHAACVLAGSGIRCCIFKELHPVPVLSFAVRYFKASAGIMITASHNPRDYNGYKVYGPDGAQLTLSDSDAVLACIQSVKDYGDISFMDWDQATAKGIIQCIGRDVDDAYMKSIRRQQVHPNLGATYGKKLKIVYTPLHGSGNVPVRRILKETGFEQVWVVPEQEEPDPGFPTVQTPNPEERNAFTLAIRLASEKEADLIIATDPDCDRVGVAVRDGNEYTLLNGNQVGCLLQEYILSQRTLLGTLPPSPFVVKTIVSSEMSRAIAARYNVEQLEVLTGFKFIGEKILQMDENGDRNYVFGFEESYGYLAGTHARDKDGVVTAMLVAEMAAWYASRGMNLLSGLNAMYEMYGYYFEEAISIGVQGKSGLERIASAMVALRKADLEAFGDWKVEKIRDYSTLEMKKPGPGSETTAIEGVPASDVLYFEMDHTAWVCVRPSGTEPKIKIYFGVSADTSAQSLEELTRLKSGVMSVVEPLLAG